MSSLALIQPFLLIREFPSVSKSRPNWRNGSLFTSPASSASKDEKKKEKKKKKEERFFNLLQMNLFYEHHLFCRCLSIKVYNTELPSSLFINRTSQYSKINGFFNLLQMNLFYEHHHFCRCLKLFKSNHSFLSTLLSKFLLIRIKALNAFYMGFWPCCKSCQKKSTTKEEGI